MLLGEGNQDISIRRTGHAGIRVREIYAAVRETDIIDNPFKLFLWDLPAKRGLDLIDPSSNLFNPRTAFQPDMQSKLAGVDQREEILTKPGN